MRVCVGDGRDCRVRVVKISKISSHVVRVLCDILHRNSFVSFFRRGEFAEDFYVAAADRNIAVGRCDIAIYRGVAAFCVKFHARSIKVGAAAEVEVAACRAFYVQRTVGVYRASVIASLRAETIQRKTAVINREARVAGAVEVTPVKCNVAVGVDYRQQRIRRRAVLD